VVCLLSQKGTSAGRLPTPETFYALALTVGGWIMPVPEPIPCEEC
jgi:hypothetical protein